MSRLISAGAVFFCIFRIVLAGDNFIIKGTVEDESTGKFIEGVKAEIIELNKFTHTNNSGYFRFDNISAGSYTLRFSSEGYFHNEILLVLDSAFTEKEIQVKLKPFESVLDTIDVHAGYYKKDVQINTSHNFAEYEELRKTPGAVEDIIKYFQSSPGVSIGSDMDNDIICRGGSPVENLILIDGIEIQNPNHYGPPGSTSGSLSYINLKLVQEADFYSGGFPVKYGERLSSVMDIKFKEGDRNKHWRDVYLSVTGFGGFFEGPVNSKSSYMLSIRRSYFELLKEQLKTPLLPDYWDVNLKLNYELNKNDKITMAGVFALDRARPYLPEEERSREKVDLKLLTYGFNYLHNSKNTSFVFTLSHNFDYYNALYDNFDLKIHQHKLTYKADFNYWFDDVNLNLFLANNTIAGKYNVRAEYGMSYTGYLNENVNFNRELNTFKTYGGFNITYKLLNNKLTANAGIRFDYLDLMTYGFVFSPRAGLSYQLSKRTFLNLNFGHYFQQPEFLWLLAVPQNKDMLYIRSNQVVIGAENFIFDDIRICAELYYKHYTNYPVSIYNPYYMFITGTTGIYPDFLAETESKGRGYFAGLDFTVQKKNTGPGFYGYLTYSYTKSKFYALSGGAQTGGFDYGHQFTVISGWKLKSLWAFSARIKYYEGKPYTPFDIESSTMSLRGVFDMSKYLKYRMPYYLRVDVRFDKEFEFSNSRLTLYFEVQNLFNRINVWSYYWKWSEGRPEYTQQWSRLPILGASFRF
jgi:hypothetical protein